MIGHKTIIGNNPTIFNPCDTDDVMVSRFRKLGAIILGLTSNTQFKVRRS